MYELWKVIKRNPINYYPRASGIIILGYLTLSFWKQNTSDWLHNNYVYSFSCFQKFFVILEIFR